MWKRSKNKKENQRESAGQPEAEEARRREMIERYGENPLDHGRALEYILNVSLHGNLEAEDVVEGDHIYYPGWQVTVAPRIVQLTERSAQLDFYVSAPQWDEPLYECSVGMGTSAESALGMACGSFLFSFLQGIARMELEESPKLLKTDFAGHPHRWRVYASNVVGMGESPQLENQEGYWEAFKEEIAKRLGNQRLCYVKIYGAKSPGQVTAECRIGNVKSEELSGRMAKIVEQWEVEQFASHKQFFFICQEEETTLENPYAGLSGRALLKEKVKTAALMFYGSRSQEAYDSLPQRLSEALGDATLATECYSYLPEMCAENAFDALTYPEAMQIKVGDAPPVTCYKSQLADYWPIRSALFALFEEGAFGEDADKVYRDYIGMSSIYSVISQIREKEGKLEDCQLTMLIFQVGVDFEIR